MLSVCTMWMPLERVKNLVSWGMSNLEGLILPSWCIVLAGFVADMASVMAAVCLLQMLDSDDQAWGPWVPSRRLEFQ